MFHGVHKISHPSSLDFISKQLASLDLPQILSYGVFVGEVIAPLMIVFGFFARLGGLLVFGNMIFAIVLAHRSQLFTVDWHRNCNYCLLSGLATYST
nr:DoxX family protein [Nitrosomonas supralitoralis]